MSLLESTKEIISTVEQLTKLPVLITEDSSLRVQATVQMARGSAAMHFVRFRRAHDSPPDYFIAYECGFIIRLYSNLPDERFDFGPSGEATQRLVRHYREKSLPEPSASITEYLTSSILTQLRSVPIGLRVDDWLFANYPELRPLQVRGAQTQLRENASVLGMDALQSFPKFIVNANTAMNAAFASYWAHSLADESLTLPYRAIGIQERGEALLDRFRAIPPGASADVALVDSWAEQLGFTGWYEWIKHERALS